MTTNFIPQAALPTGGDTLAADPSRWNDALAYHYGGFHSRAIARRELAATLSAIVGGTRRIDMRHNAEGRWAVLIDDETLATTIVLHWCENTVDENGHSVPVTRGQALFTLVHEAMHVLFTSDIPIPSWLRDPAHASPFHTILNFAEDVRIEDLGEDVVPAFANIRRAENDRLLPANAQAWPSFDIVRKVCIVLFAERSCGSGASSFATRLAMEPEIARLVDECRQSFIDATNAPDTMTTSERLRPMYETLLPYLPSSGGGIGPGGDDDTTTGGDGGSGEPDESGDDTITGGDTTPATGDGDPIDDDTNDGGDGDGDDGTDDDGDGGKTPGDDDEEPRESDNTTITDPRWRGETINPNAPVGDWDNHAPREVPEQDDSSPDWFDDVIEGRPITCGWGEDGGTVVLDEDHAASTTTRLRVVKTLRRVLQDNANGGWSTRRKSGTFDPRNATRLAIGDMRTFRKKRGARGSLDYSLVLCLDASGSVSGYCGEQIARAGLSVYEAAYKIPGLDVAICSYGSGVHFGMPFDSTLRDVQRDGSRNRARLSALLAACHNGIGGSTAEDAALTWAVAASRRRSADSQMIIVMTDGVPNNRHAMPTIIDDARTTGIRTGGIGVLHDAPEYHEYATTVTDLTDLPRVLGDLITTMMKGR